MNNFKGRVRSRCYRWLIWTAISGAFVLLMNAGFIYVIAFYMGIEPDSFSMKTILYVTSTWVLIALLMGQLVHGIIQQTWDTWIANLDEYSLEILIATLIHTFEKSTDRKYTVRHDTVQLLRKDK